MAKIILPKKRFTDAEYAQLKAQRDKVWEHANAESKYLHQLENNTRKEWQRRMKHKTILDTIIMQERVERSKEDNAGLMGTAYVGKPNKRGDKWYVMVTGVIDNGWLETIEFWVDVRNEALLLYDEDEEKQRERLAHIGSCSYGRSPDFYKATYNHFIEISPADFWTAFKEAVNRYMHRVGKEITIIEV